IVNMPPRRRWLWLVVCLPVILYAAASLQEIESKAVALKASGDAAGALAAYQEAATINPKSPRYQDEIGFLLAVLNRRSEAIEHLTRAIELDSQFAPAHFHLGVAWWLEHDAARAISELQTAVNLDPENGAYQSKLGQALETSGQHQEAFPHLKAAVRLQPADALA